MPSPTPPTPTAGKAGPRDPARKELAGHHQLRLLAYPVAAWAFSIAVSVVAGYFSNVDPLSASSYSRWDSALYEDIAVNGYEFFSCARLPGYNPSDWCGNAGWMPGYPLLVRLLLAFPIDWFTAGFIISNVFLLGTFIVFGKLIEDAYPDREQFLCFLIAAVFPGGIYFHALFPISMLLFFAFLTILLLGRQRFFWASCTAACGALVYSTGFLLSGVVAVGILVKSDAPWPRRFAEAALYGAIAFAGFISVLLIHHVALGQWDAFFLTQAKYGHVLSNPFATLLGALQQLQKTPWNLDKAVPVVQTLLLSIVLMGLVGRLLARAPDANAIEWIVVAHVALFWLFPLSLGSGVSLTRAEANLLPLVLLIVQLPRVLQGLIFVLFVALYFEISGLFFRSILV